VAGTFLLRGPSHDGYVTAPGRGSVRLRRRAATPWPPAPPDLRAPASWLVRPAWREDAGYLVTRGPNVRTSACLSLPVIRRVICPRPASAAADARMWAGRGA